MPETGQVQTNDLDETLRMWLHQIMYCMIRGALSCFFNVKPEKVLAVTCLVLGQIISELYRGDEIAVHRFRKYCRDAFSETTKRMPIIPAPEQPSDKTEGMAI